MCSILVILNDIFELPTLKYIYAPNFMSKSVLELEILEKIQNCYVDQVNLENV